MTNTTGSSPRGRGTALARACRRLKIRFIPAWAGNRSEREARTTSLSVHPRVGGEQARVDFGDCATGGSSPRGRGTGRSHPLSAVGWRFIPAWAGNRGAPQRGRARSAVHPRVGGEQGSKIYRKYGTTGSSPRGRGTGIEAPASGAHGRFIPAWAGNRCSSCWPQRWPPVHPRVGGEQPVG